MITLSSISLVTHNCEFEEEMSESPGTFMMFLLYFRTHECSDTFSWKYLGVKSKKEKNELNFLEYLPEENEATRRTHALSLTYLIFNILLFLSCSLLLGEIY